MKDITVIVASFQPIWKKLRATVISIIKQENCNFDIVVCDDGSSIDYFDELRDLFYEYQFSDYKLVKNTVNQGTVLNILSGLEKAQGRYIKLISPGDYFYLSDSLYNWYQYMVDNNYNLSFCDAAYYNSMNDNLNIVQEKCHPCVREIYIKYSRKNIKYNYLGLDDFVLGASLLAKKELLTKYIDLIKGKVVYCEDLMYKIMIFDDVEIHYFPQVAIWYEYGTGITTKNKMKANDKFNYDYMKIEEIITRRNTHSILSRRFQKLYKKRYKISNRWLWRVYKRICIPELIYYDIYRKFHFQLTNREFDTSFYMQVTK